MNRIARWAAPGAAVLLAALAGAGAAAGDVLVTRDGATVETRGAWSVEGRRVIFTLANGTLSSLRTDEVDLDRSALATARAAEAAARAATPATETATAPLAPPPPPVFRITDKDLEPSVPAEPEAEESAAGETGEPGAPSGASDGPLEVISWDRVDLAEGDGVEIFGTIRNNGSSMVTAPSLSLAVYGERGGLLATSDGSVNLAAIPPGKTANFRAPLPGLHDFAAIKFDLGGRGYRTRGAEAAEGAGPGDELGEEPAAEEEVDVDPGAKYDEMAENLYEEPVAEEGTESESEPIDEEPPPLD